MLIVPKDFRAPLFVPGRRNRRVHWNRTLSRAMASLGSFEREDYYRGTLRPWSLRQFFPAWNNQFSPGGGSGCGCCEGDTPTCVDGIENCFGGSFPPEVFVTIPNAFTGSLGCTGDVADCADIGGTYSAAFFSGSGTNATFRSNYIICASGLGDINLDVQVGFLCSGDTCLLNTVSLRVGTGGIGAVPVIYGSSLFFPFPFTVPWLTGTGFDMGCSVDTSLSVIVDE
jgi:hypothetical protein